MPEIENDDSKVEKNLNEQAASQETVPVENKVEETAAKEPAKAPETAAPTAEKAHVEAQPIAPATVQKQKKAFPWKPVLKVAGIAALSVGCGFGGGYLAGQQSIASATTSAQAEMQNANGEGGFMRGKDFSGSMPDSNGSSSSSTATTGAALGVYVQTTNNQVAIAGFSSNSTAESAGLQTGDIITALDSTKISSYDDITSFLADKSAGDTVKVTVTRDSKEVSATITLVEKSGMTSGGTTGGTTGGSTNGGSSDKGSSGQNSMPSQGKPDTQSGSTSKSSSSSSSSSLQG